MGGRARTNLFTLIRTAASEPGRMVLRKRCAVQMWTQCQFADSQPEFPGRSVSPNRFRTIENAAPDFVRSLASSVPDV